MNVDSNSKQKLPAIVFDIDGVVHKGPELVGDSPHVVTSLFNEGYGVQKNKIPFVFLTNGGMKTEDEKAKQMNVMMDLDNYQTKLGINPPKLVQRPHVIMCHTPLGEKSLVDKYNAMEAFVLVLGEQGSQTKLAVNYNLQRYITTDEFCGVFPEVTYYVGYEYNKARLTMEKNNFFKRYNLEFPNEDSEEYDAFRKNLAISSIMIWCNVTQEGLCNQICCDLLSSRYGTIMGAKRRTEKQGDGTLKVIDPQAVVIYFTNNDLLFAHNWHEPRFAPKSFTVMLEVMFKDLYGYDYDCILYGKPETIAYQYAERAIQVQCDENDVQVSTFYMIGDNPASDIEGGIRIGKHNLEETGVNNWKTILLRSGVWKEGEDTKGAHYICDNMRAAYELILKEHGLDKK